MVELPEEESPLGARGLPFWVGEDGCGRNVRGDAAEMFIKELLDPLVECWAPEAVATVGHGDEDGFNADTFQCGIDFLSLGIGHQWIFRAMSG